MHDLDHMRAIITKINEAEYKSGKPYRKKYDDRIEHYLDGKLHRDNDQPAVVYRNGKKTWWVNGERHRDNDQPAYIGSYGRKYWWVNGKQHRDNDQPAVTWPDGSKEWYVNGKRHRDNDKPAAIYADGSKAWYVNDRLHRDNGPAIIHADGLKQWWVDGNLIKQEKSTNENINEAEQTVTTPSGPDMSAVNQGKSLVQLANQEQETQNATTQGANLTAKQTGIDKAVSAAVKTPNPGEKQIPADPNTPQQKIDPNAAKTAQAGGPVQAQPPGQPPAPGQPLAPGQTQMAMASKNGKTDKFLSELVAIATAVAEDHPPAEGERYSHNPETFDQGIDRAKKDFGGAMNKLGKRDWNKDVNDVMQNIDPEALGNTMRGFKKSFKGFGDRLRKSLKEPRQ